MNTATMTVTEFARRIGLTPRGVIDLLRRGVIEGEKIGGAGGVWLISPTQLPMAKRRRRPGRPFKSATTVAE